MKFVSWEDYRRRVVLPAGYKNEGQPGVWVRRSEEGPAAVFLPWTYRAEWGCELWHHLAEQGLGPDGEPIAELAA